MQGAPSGVAGERGGVHLDQQLLEDDVGSPDGGLVEIRLHLGLIPAIGILVNPLLTKLGCWKCLL